jgi:hypothetical protein
MAKLSFRCGWFLFSIMLFSSCFQNSFIIQELFFQLIELRKGNQFFFEAYFSERKRAEKMSLMKTPMDKAIINKNKTKACWT